MPNTRIKPLNQRPYDQNISQATGSWMDQITVLVNNLVGQVAPAGVGLPTVQNNTINLGSAQVMSTGSRATSITTGIIAVPSATSVSFFWDGTNGSVPFVIYRDDGTSTPPIFGNYTVTSLTPSTLYYFYPYWDETLAVINWAGITNVSVGVLPVAFTAQNVLAVQAQALRNRIPLATTLSQSGVTTTSSGTGAPFFGGNGGGAGRGGFAELR
jgi:hypothetical protein